MSEPRPSRRSASAALPRRFDGARPGMAVMLAAPFIMHAPVVATLTIALGGAIAVLTARRRPATPPGFLLAVGVVLLAVSISLLLGRDPRVAIVQSSHFFVFSVYCFVM